jgi:hypothetical protein
MTFAAIADYRYFWDSWVMSPYSIPLTPEQTNGAPYLTQKHKRHLSKADFQALHLAKTDFPYWFSNKSWTSHTGLFFGAFGSPRESRGAPLPPRNGCRVYLRMRDPGRSYKINGLFSIDCIYVTTKCDKCRLALFRIQFLALCICGSQDNTFLVCTHCFS